MYIQLTRIDGSPIWLNASFIVTIEPTRNGGSIVVPIGDGLDYEVRESADAVLGLLKEAPCAAVVPVPPPRSLAPTPKDVSPETPEADEASRGQKASAPKKAAKASARPKRAATAASARKPKDDAKDEAPAEAQDNGQPAADGVAGDASPSVPPADDAIGQIIEKLKAHKCRTEKRLMNFIKSSNKTISDADVIEIMAEMKGRGYFTVEDDGHVTWA